MTKRSTFSLLMGGASLLAASTAFAQGTPPAGQAADPGTPPPTSIEAGPADPGAEEEIVVVGSQIRGADVTDVLPVVVLGEEDIAAIAATSGDELFRSIPQAGDVAFNESRDAGGINDARGDTASINLRALGTGNTLVLINGRRMVLHPGTQAENLVPVQSVNTNTIPVMGVRRLEVLLDGAAAIYGTDAVAGVINTVLKDNLDGFAVAGELQFTGDSGQVEHQLGFEAGHTFNDGRTNISLFGAYEHRDPLFAGDRPNSRSSDLRPFVEGTPFEGDANFDNTNTSGTPWGEFQRLNSDFEPVSTTVRVNGAALTTGGTFHVQPATNDGCIAPAGPGVCYDNSSLSTTTADRNLRYDINSVRNIMGENQRINLFGFLNHEFSDSFEFFGEVGYYHADYNSMREQEVSLASQRLIIPANGFYNPLGPVGSPNRIPGLTGVPAEGVALELEDYRVVDAGPLTYNVKSTTTRFLGGFRGEIAGWDWESAALYSRAHVNDTMRQPSVTLFQAALARTDASAYNPFTGGDPLNPSFDSTPNPQSVIDSFMVDISRISTTELALGDLRLSRNDLFDLPAGRVGVAAGIEYRYETFEDDRDDRLDGTIAFVAFDGSSNGSDTLGASPTPDTSGSRDVFSSYLEFAVPVVSPEMDVPLVHSIDMQLAGRFEQYEGFGSVAKPKVAVSYYPIEWLQFRGAWSQGFRAPNLPQLFEQGIQRANGREDFIRCEAELRAGRIDNFDDCEEGQTVVSNRSGSQELEPEKAENWTIGATVEPPLPNGWGRLTLTADYWQIKQRDVIGLLGDTNQLILDYLLRVQGSSNPNVQRAAPTPEDIEQFAGTGIEPVGEIIQVIDNYTNLSPRTVEGVDLGLYYDLDDTAIGDIGVKLNAARLIKFFQQPGPIQQMLIDAQADGTIDSTLNIPGAEDLIEENGRPKWRGTAIVTWRLGQVGAGYYGSYVGGVTDTSASLDDGTRFPVDDHLTHNLYVQYTVDSPGAIDGARLRVGVRNLTNNLPPLADQSFGYIGDLYSNRGRTFYASLRASF